MFCGTITVNAQQKFTLDGGYNTITTAVPFMRITPDARSGGMGDVGIAISPDANAQYWNVAKLAMSKKDAGASITYTPWLKGLVDDISLSYLSGYMKFGEKDNKNQAVGVSMRYFSMGSIYYTNIDAKPAGIGNPREMAFDVSYSRKLSEKFSVGVTGKYIYSNILNGAARTSSTKAGTSFGVDFGAFYTTQLKASDENSAGSSISAGAVITNLGSKVGYGGEVRDFIPTNLGLGVAYDYNIDEYNKLTIGMDLNKLLVPSPQYRDTLIAGNIVQQQYYPRNKTLISGVFSSFGDAPGGFGEELKEWTVSTGAEYSYQNQFFARAGYFYEAKLKGNRKYLSLGLGVKYSVFGLNFAYIVPSGSSATRNPLSNVLRFSLVFDFDNFATMVKGKKEEPIDERAEKPAAPSKR
jgi:hypothetical protein